MAKSSKELIEMGWKSTETETGNKIVLALFSAFPGGLTQDEIRKELIKSKLKPKEEEKDKKIKEFELGHSRSKDSLNNIVSNYIRAFLDLGYCIPIGEKERISKYHKNIEYGLQLKFFFDYANEKLPKGKKFVYQWGFGKHVKKDWGDAFYLDWEMISGVRKIILKYPPKKLIKKIKLYLFDAYVLQNTYLRLDNNTREKIMLLVGLNPKISEEIQKYYHVDENKTEELLRKQISGGYISPDLIKQSNQEKMYESWEENIRFRKTLEFGFKKEKSRKK